MIGIPISQAVAGTKLFVLKNNTTNNTPTELFLDGSSSRFLIPPGKTYSFIINIIGSRDDGSAVSNYVRQFALKNVSGTTSQVFAPIQIGSDNPAGTQIDVTANNTDDALKITVTGITSQNWKWRAFCQGVELTY
jgi:hypothetical protein